MNIIGIDPRSDPLWPRLLRSYGGSVFLSPPWLEVLAQTYGFQMSALVALNERSEPCAGLPFCYISDLAGDRIVSLPFSDYCDPLVAEPAQWECLVTELIKERLPITLRCLNCHIPTRDPRFTRVKSAKWHGVNLREDLHLVRQRFEVTVSQKIRQSYRRGLCVQIAQDIKPLRRFFDLHLQVRKRKYRLLAQPYRFFENIWHYFMEAGKGVLMLAVYDGQVIAGSLYLEWDGTFYYKFSASDPAYLSYRPNDLLVWEGIKYAKERDCLELDLGLSDVDQEGLLHFKRKFGSEEGEIIFLRHVPEGKGLRQEQQFRQHFDSLTPLLTHDSVPEDITEAGGEILYGLLA
jgi:CelD/BcsL family acetyltransferase involved in cellulose biosynthesis